MRIRWDYERIKWLIWPGDMSEAEWKMLEEACALPEYYDNWPTGDVYFYSRGCGIGEIINVFNDNEYDLEILY